MKPVYRPGALVMILALVTWALIGWVIYLLSPRGEVIWSDPGGSIAARVAMVRDGGPVEIAGRCASSCTMHLANGCVTPGAVLVFHGPQTVVGFDLWSDVMAWHYPPAIADWFMAQGRYGQWEMTGADAIRLGAQECTVQR